MEKQITYDDLSLIGMELFRKNNDTFLRSKLSSVMRKIFLAANRNIKIDDIESVNYMKSGVLPNKVFYIYSDAMSEQNEKKMYDVVNFNGETCIWFYSNNTINMVDNNPVYNINQIYTILIDTFIEKPTGYEFIHTESFIAKNAMNIKLMQFLHETYGVLDVDSYKRTTINSLNRRYPRYTDESIEKFIDDVMDNYYNNSYFKNRDYLTSYLLLEYEK